MHRGRFFTGLFLALMIFFPVSVLAGSATLSWQACSETDLSQYRVYYGTSSRTYGPPIPVGNVCSYTVNELTEGQTYYFAVTAIDTAGNESGFSSEVAKTILQTTTPSYQLTLSRSSDRSNPVPLENQTISDGVYIFVTPETDISQVVFSIDGETHNTENYAPFDLGQPFDTTTLGDGVHTISARILLENSSEQTTSAVCSVANETTSGGTALPMMEVGEINLDHNWFKVNLNNSYTNPVVVANSLSYNGLNPSVIRIRNITSTGFEIAVQEWDYCDGEHLIERVGYVVVEEGHYTLPDGKMLEAGIISHSGTNEWRTFSYQEAFNQNPVVLTSISTHNGLQGVVCRKNNLHINGFDLCFQEQEAYNDGHLEEAVSYIAWEPGTGQVNNIDYEVGKTENAVTQDFFDISFSQDFESTPFFMADIQSFDGTDPASTRWRNKSSSGVQLMIEEEMSMDSEINHVTEEVGYFVFSTN